MAVVFSPDVVELAVRQEYAGRPAVNVWHMRLTPGWGAATAEAAARDFLNNWQDHIMPLLDSGVSLLGLTYRSIDEGNSAAGDLDPDPAKPVVGGQAGTGMPPNVAYLIHKRTSTRPRGRRDGRAYLVGVQEGFVDERGSLDSTVMSTWPAELEDFYNGISDTGVGVFEESFPVVLETTAASRAKGSAEVTIASRRVTSITLDPLVATQRDRLR